MFGPEAFHSWWIIQTSGLLTCDSASVPGPSNKTCQQWVSPATEACWQSSPVLHPGIFIFPLISFRFHVWLLNLIHSSPTWQSLSQNTLFLKDFCFITVFFVCLGGDCSCPWFKGEVSRWAYLGDFTPPFVPEGCSVIMIRKQTNGQCSTRAHCRRNNKKISKSMWFVLLRSVFRRGTSKANPVYLDRF